MNVTLVGVLASLLVLVLTVELLRRRALREKYAVLWLVVSIVAVLFTVFPSLLGEVSARLGFAVPANFLFALAALVLLVVSMQLSLEVGRLENRTQRLAEELAILRHDVEATQARDAPERGAPAPGTVGPDDADHESTG
jgi:hypothetical protein